MTPRTPEPAADFRWRPLLLPAYGPTALVAVGNGALLPIIALAAIHLGAGIGTAAFVVALVSIGQLCGDVPAGALAARIGEKRALSGACVVDAAALLLAFAVQTLPALMIAMTVNGVAGAVFNLARHTWMTVAIPTSHRARAMSALGGTFRFGKFVGPFLAAGLISIWSLPAVFLFAAVVALAAGVLTLRLPELALPPTDPAIAATRVTVWTVMRDERRVLLTVGVGMLVLSAARAARTSVLPLWAGARGLDPTTVSLIFGVAAGIELLVVYPGGAVMDRYGRVWVAVPAVLLMGLGLGLLPLTHAVTTIGLIACLMAIGDGLSSGVVMTLGSDAAPAVGRPQFLGAWRLIADVGAVLGPGTVALMTLFAPLAAASLTLAGIAAVGSGWLIRWIPRREHPR